MVTQSFPATLRADRSRALSEHAARLATAAPGELFAAASDRFGTLALEVEGLLLDLTRQRLDAAALADLVGWATECRLAEHVEALYAGVHVNHTEDRPALHVALRDPALTPKVVDGVDVHGLVHAERTRLRAYVREVRSGARRGHGGELFTDVLNIGIGGSDLGPVMAYEALAGARKAVTAAEGGRALRAHFASNIDGARLSTLLESLNPATTLVLICSKTFTTQETLTNARLARAWLAGALGEAAVPSHFAAVSTNAKGMDAFGVGADARFTMWDWVGGRYSLWSAIGLSVELCVGSSAWEEFLAGGHAMDRHFAMAPVARNLPVLLGLVGAWNRNFLDIPSLGVLPYDDRLLRFPAYLQQLEMESNGKGVRRDGSRVAWGTCPVMWGEPGNNAQHSFFQLLHQGNAPSALDVLVPARSSAGLQPSADLAVANAMAQVEAFARGYTLEEASAELRSRGRSAEDVARLAPHKVHPGGRPTTVLAFEQLNARTLGKLVALYEHKVFVQSVLWDLNPFDQWGVELGKKMAEGLAPFVGAEAPAHLPVLAWLNGRR